MQNFLDLNRNIEPEQHFKPIISTVDSIEERKESIQRLNVQTIPEN